MKKIEKIDMIIGELFAEKASVTWSEIMEAINAELKIKNWMDVRGIVQFQINEGEIERTSDLNTETYLRVS